METLAHVPASDPATVRDTLQVVAGGLSAAHVVADEPTVVEEAPAWRDLAPEIHRQRLVVEGTCTTPITDAAIRDYLTQLSEVCGMVTLIEPVTHRSDRFGWAGWIHWETSGAHFYAWEEPRLFFSVDIYTCKAFDPVAATTFTRDYFDAPSIVARAF